MYRRAFSATACATAFACAALASSPAAAISTYKAWDGAEYVWTFGCPDSSTYGQVITIPKGKPTLNKFTFSWASAPGSTGSMVVRGEVYAWDGTKATGEALWESKKLKISYSDTDFHQQDFKPGALPLTPGAQYVIFASIDKDFEKCTNNYTLTWGFISAGAYDGGDFVYQNNEGNESNWTNAAWNGFGGDLAFKAALK